VESLALDMEELHKVHLQKPTSIL